MERCTTRTTREVAYLWEMTLSNRSRMFCGHLALNRAGRFSWEDAAFTSFCFRCFFAGGGAGAGVGRGVGRLVGAYEVDACDEYGRAGRGGIQLVSSSVRSMMSSGSAFLFAMTMKRLADREGCRRVGRGERKTRHRAGMLRRAKQGRRVPTAWTSPSSPAQPSGSSALPPPTPAMSSAPSSPPAPSPATSPS